jgi:hypothetical protein
MSYVITLQVRKSPSVCFPKASNDHDDLDNPSLWEECGEEYNADVEAIQTNCRKQILHCFAHSLQLVIRDGLKETKMIHSMLAKVTKLCSLLHTTCGLKEAFATEFGVNSSVPDAVSTRWNSILQLVKVVTNLNQQSLHTLLEAQGPLLITK